MVYLISVDSDSSTADIAEWLFRFKKDFLRVNNIIEIQNRLDFFPVKLSSASFNANKNKAPNIDLPSVFFRRLNNFEHVNNLSIRNFYINETITLAKFIFENKVDYRKIIGIPTTGIFINKLTILSIAQKFGLSIPSTIITNSKGDLEVFYKEYKKIIGKPISDVFYGKQNGKLMTTHTKLIQKSFISSLPNFFPSSLFQQYIEKEYELRIFYLEGKLYPMVIFSQDSNKTKIDFRKYNFKKPNRTVPYKLPKDTEDKLLCFLQEHKFDAGSVDMIKCKNTGKYYFLEVNPHGQFGMVSAPCNYYLEKKIAELL